MRKRELLKFQRDFELRNEGYLDGLAPDFLVYAQLYGYASAPRGYSGSVLKVLAVDTSREKPILVEGIEKKPVWVCYKNIHKADPGSKVKIRYKGLSEQEYLEAQEAKRRRALNPYCEDRFGKRLKDSLAGYYPSRVVYQHRGKMNDSIVKSIKWSKENNVVITMNNDDKLIFSLSDGDTAGQQPDSPLICDEIVVLRK